MNSIYSINPSSGGVALERVWAQAPEGGLAAGYTGLVPLRLGARTALFAYDKASRKACAYSLGGAAPFLRAADARPDLGELPWDNLAAFVFGNEPHLLAYHRETGTFGFFRVSADLSVSKPYTFALPRNTPTRGFTEVAPYTSLGRLYVAGYDYDTGTVANFAVTTTPTSAGGAPPLLAQNVWYHHWAKGWTRFAFFQLGGANFFFKINAEKLNVNIDHMQDDPSLGSVEVGSYLQSQLPDALSIDLAAVLPWAGGEPYLLTYIAAGGATAVYRIHADCQGWSSVYAGATDPGAKLVAPYRVGDRTFVLFYRP